MFLIRKFALSILLGMAPSSLSAQYELHLQVLETDEVTAGFIEKALEGGEFNNAQIEERLEKLKRGNRLKEIASFKKEFKNGEGMEFKADQDELEFADGVKMPVGLDVMLNPNVSNHGYVDALIEYRHRKSLKKNQNDLDEISNIHAVEAGAWEILAAFGDGSDVTLLMALITGVKEEDQPDDSAFLLQMIQMNGDLLLCDIGDLETFGRSTPATREKAIEWLEKRSEKLNSFSLRDYSGQFTRLQSGLEWIYDTDKGWDTTLLGLSIDCRSQIGPHGKLVDLEIDGYWSDRDVPKPEGALEYKFDYGGTKNSGELRVITPTNMPATGKVPVMLVTTKVINLVEGKPRSGYVQKAKPGEITSRYIPVHPSFERKVMELTGQTRMLQPGKPRLSMKQMLMKLGMTFPDNSDAAFVGNGCMVILRHNDEGEGAFWELLKKHGVGAPVGE